MANEPEKLVWKNLSDRHFFNLKYSLCQKVDKEVSFINLSRKYGITN